MNRIDLYYRLKKQYEDTNYYSRYRYLDIVLYYFSFFGNAVIVALSYFFLKDVINNLPYLFNGDKLIFSVFVIIFMSLYELLKRFLIDKFFMNVFEKRKYIINLLFTIAIISGSFYLSVNGGHRLVDKFEKQVYVNNDRKNFVDSINRIYQPMVNIRQSAIDSILSKNRTPSYSQRMYINLLQNQINYYRSLQDSLINDYDKRYEYLSKFETKNTSSNRYAFIFIATFLELIIIIGVGYHEFFEKNVYDELKKYFSVKYKDLDLYIKLIHILYNKGKKQEGEKVITRSSMLEMCKSSSIEISLSKLDKFMEVCKNVGIISGEKRNKIYAKSYNEAIDIIKSSFYE